MTQNVPAREVSFYFRHSSMFKHKLLHKKCNLVSSQHRFQCTCTYMDCYLNIKWYIFLYQLNKFQRFIIWIFGWKQIQHSRVNIDSEVIFKKINRHNHMYLTWWGYPLLVIFMYLTWSGYPWLAIFTWSGYPLLVIFTWSGYPLLVIFTWSGYPLLVIFTWSGYPLLVIFTWSGYPLLVIFTWSGYPLLVIFTWSGYPLLVIFTGGFPASRYMTKSRLQHTQAKQIW